MDSSDHAEIFSRQFPVELNGCHEIKVGSEGLNRRVDRLPERLLLPHDSVLVVVVRRLELSIRQPTLATDQGSHIAVAISEVSLLLVPFRQSLVETEERFSDALC